MAREELNLRRALLVTVTGTRPEVLGSEVLEEVAHCFSIKLEDMTIQSAKPEDFLLFFPNEETAMRVLNDGKVLRGPRFSLVFKRWSRFSHASTSIMLSLVEVEITGIAVHAWCRSTAEFILGDSCIIEEVHPDTLLQKTLPSFVARAWCFQLKQLHRDMILHILEPGPQSSERRCLAYNISVRVLAICHDGIRGSSLLTPPEDGDQSDGSDDMDDQRNDEPRRLGSPLPQRQSVHIRLRPPPPSGHGRTSHTSRGHEQPLFDAPELQQIASDNGMILLNELPTEKPNSLLDEPPINSWTCTIGPLNSTQPFSPQSKVTGSLEMTGLSSPLPVMSRLGPLGSLTPARPVSPQSVRNETQKLARLGSPLSLACVQPCISSGSLAISNLKVYSRRKNTTPLLPTEEHVQPVPEQDSPPIAKFFSKICKKSDALLPTPRTPLVATPISGVQAPRRSRRLAGIGVEFDLHKEKSNLHKEKSKPVRKAMVALKCISENEGINNEALQEYATLFNRCLNQVQVEALSALFGWTLSADLES
jgi:hypothetical protein